MGASLCLCHWFNYWLGHRELRILTAWRLRTVHVRTLSIYKQCTVLSAVPLPPTNLTASEVTSDSVTLTWTSGDAEPFQSYIIQYRRKYSSDNYTFISGVLNTQYTVSPIEANTAYEFRIVAVNDAGQSKPSPPLHVSTSNQRGTNKLAECNNHICKYIIRIIANVLNF